MKRGICFILMMSFSCGWCTKLSKLVSDNQKSMFNLQRLSSLSSGQRITTIFDVMQLYQYSCTVSGKQLDKEISCAYENSRWLGQTLNDIDTHEKLRAQVKHLNKYLAKIRLEKPLLLRFSAMLVVLELLSKGKSFDNVVTKQTLEHQLRTEHCRLLLLLHKKEDILKIAQ